ncbi:flavohemoglobin expression-modulating QEGLA motif protein [Citricoccus sp. SGAir0253]|uniref:flavohemoglobin expression-modulating QEGLA motif protein n=1 Tax=Citricoccus sp. SGAir0253 TaxID=2567881 RepID=UPI001FEEB554|nr:tyrosine/phenylalanine carboxypeptidase domain-containing protein [Citricoccus sp. SGAir0253]
MSATGTGLSTRDRAIDHELALLSRTFRFLLDVTPVNVEDARREFLSSGRLPEFLYRDLEDDPEVLKQVLADVPIHEVDDTVLGTLLRNKHREMSLQIDMLSVRDTEDFMPLSIDLYGAITPDLRRSAESILETVTVTESTSAGTLDAKRFLDRAHEEIEYYREQDPDIDLHAEVRPDVSGVMVAGDTLLIGQESKVQKVRAHALLQHEVGTHLVTHVNGAAQPVKVLGSGLAGYDETQEGLAVLAEVACGGLTRFRLRQLAARVLTVQRMVTGASFQEAHEALVEDGVPASSAFTTTMRAFRAGGLTKDAIYLRGMLDLLAHLRHGGTLDLLLLGKFSLEDLPMVRDLQERGVLEPPVLRPRWLEDEDAPGRLARAAAVDDPWEDILR